MRVWGLGLWGLVIRVRGDQGLRMYRGFGGGFGVLGFWLRGSWVLGLRLGFRDRGLRFAD